MPSKDKHFLQSNKVPTVDSFRKKTLKECAPWQNVPRSPLYPADTDHPRAQCIAYDQKACTRVQLFFIDLLLYERDRKCVTYFGVVTFLLSKSK